MSFRVFMYNASYVAPFSYVACLSGHYGFDSSPLNSGATSWLISEKALTVWDPVDYFVLN